MTVAFILAGVIAVAIIALETWGRRQPLSPLVSRAALRHSLELLRSRGVDGSALVIRLPESQFALVAEKRVLSGKPLLFRVRAEVSKTQGQWARWGRGKVDSEVAPEPKNANDSATLGHEIREAESIDELIGHLDAAAQSLGSRLFPGARAQFRGDVLAFNISRETGTEI